MRFEISVKPTFLNQLRAMPNKDVGLMIKKVVILQTDPSPRGSLKKKMEGYKDLYRLRAGDYRVFYNYGDGWVTLLGVGTHDMYGNPPAFWSPNLDTRAVPSGDLSAEPNRLGTRDRKGRWEWIDQESEQTKTDLARPIDNALVERLNVPKEFWPALCVCRTVEDLYSAKVPNSIRDRVFDAASAPNYDLVLQQPDYVTGDPSNLLRFVEGDLPGFLLKLDAYQEKYVEWAISETGPTLVKGGPGTGKSTIALYRVRSFLRVLRASGVPRPRILFTTYTNALTRFSEQLLRHLLGDDSELVEVRTADRVANDLVSRVDGPQKVAYAKDIKPFLTDAISSSAFNGGAKSRPQALTIQGMTGDYLFEEIGSVIEANGLQSLDEYVAIPRSAQSIPLNASQRAAVWRVYESLSQIMRRKGWISLQELHRRALDLLRSGSSLDRYDAVVIDEAQDLDPNLLRTLFALCRSRNRVFVTADTNQSIYRNNFRWSDISEDLGFQDRIGVLRKNHRSTQEIGEATMAYLRAGSPEEQPVDPDYAHAGGLMPVVRFVGGTTGESQVLAHFLRQASREHRLGLSSCAVLVPTEKDGSATAGRLSDAGIDAKFMSGKDLDLDEPVVKVITLHSAKGLEFPVVALAGFAEGALLGLPRGRSVYETEGAMLKARRVMFVGMTRAMRALLVVLPSGSTSPLFDGFDEQYWNVGQWPQ